MDDGKEKLKELFFKNVYGLSPNIENYNKKHAGAKGHWLEKKLGKNPDSDNSADFWGYECKNFTKSLTTWGDWTANKYIFDKKNNFNLDRDHFLQIFGKPNREKNNRCSWSGEPVPSYPNKFSNFGQLMTIDEFSNIKIQYSFLKDKRENKSYILPKEFQIDNLELAVWYGYEKYNQTKKTALETKVNRKFNQKGWFKCIIEDKVYKKIVFGNPVNFESWIDHVKKENIYFDSGMYQGNRRPYSMWRSINSFWGKLIYEEFTKET